MKIQLFEYLNADGALTALVSDRIFPIVSPNSAAYPRVTYQRISNFHERHMTASAGLSRATYQLDSWALSSLSATSVAEALREALDGFMRKTMGTTSPVFIHSIFLEEEEDSIEPPDDASQVSIFRIRQDFTINHAETVPTP